MSISVSDAMMHLIDNGDLWYHRKIRSAYENGEAYTVLRFPNSALERKIAIKELDTAGFYIKGCAGILDVYNSIEVHWHPSLIGSKRFYRAFFWQRTRTYVAGIFLLYVFSLVWLLHG